jgi:hypothetical protein
MNQLSQSTSSLPLQLPAKIKPRLLIITDSSERWRELRVRLGTDGIEVVGASSIAEAERAGRAQPDLIVVDVEPVKLNCILKAIRDCAQYHETSLLVDISRISGDPAMAGVLPRFRAMACSHHDMRLLIRRQLSSALPIRQPRRML